MSHHMAQLVIWIYTDISNNVLSTSAMFIIWCSNFVCAIHMMQLVFWINGVKHCHLSLSLLTWRGLQFIWSRVIKKVLCLGIFVHTSSAIFWCVNVFFVSTVSWEFNWLESFLKSICKAQYTAILKKCYRTKSSFIHLQWNARTAKQKH